MKLLLDTHILLWALMAPGRLPAPLRDVLTDPVNEVLFSAASIWEVSIKRSLDRPGFDFMPDDVIAGAVAAGFTEAPVTARHAARVLELPRLHTDPFDRLLVAQALCEPARLVTADRAVAAYPALVDFVTPL